MSGALAGLRVLDLTRYIPGPYATMLLADLGADVVKIEEPPFGDATRAVPPPLPSGADTAVHAALNRGKRSVQLDLRQAEGVAAVKRLAARADVFVEAFRPGALERRGLGAAALRAANPRLVYCSVSGYGQAGPLASVAGHDVNYLARSGFLGTNLDAAGDPVLPTTQVADMAGGLLAALAILAALQARERSGEGQVVDVSMFDAALALMTVPAARVLAGGSSTSELSGRHACYGTYRCRDGRHVAVGALEPKFWEGLCAALELPHLRSRQWDQGPRREEVRAALAAAFAGRDRDDWVTFLRERDVCVEPVLDLPQALAQEQAATRGVIAAGALSSPLRLAATPVVVPRKAPALGQHTDEVLAEAGFAAAEIAALRERGIAA
ncbi:MAG: CoA transferase [Vicinamibacteria bacterium]|nr:CoA transferase [Vicinamibacteria bacterium]